VRGALLTHVIEGQIDISVVLRPDYMLQSDNILMSSQCLCEMKLQSPHRRTSQTHLQVHDLAKSALCIRSIPKSVEAFLERDYLSTSLLNSFPNYPVCLCFVTQGCSTCASLTPLPKRWHISNLRSTCLSTSSDMLCYLSTRILTDGTEAVSTAG
jgi:hypothetical protein